MRAIRPLLALTAVLLTGLLAGCTTVRDKAVSNETQTDSLEAIDKARNKPAIRGGIVYKTYCILCHGERADGMSRGARLYVGATLSLSSPPSEYTEKIIRYGGASVDKSKYMPGWQEELSEEQIKDVMAYLAIVQDPVARGGVVFKTNCILCHGVKGDGKGRASVLFNPPPANLTTSDKNDVYKKMIITLGGKAMGRSEVMPAWGEQLLTEQQIDDVVAYLRSILIVQAQ